MSSPPLRRQAPLLVQVAVSGWTMALPAASIAEMVHEPALVRPPRLPAAVAGVFDLRGRIVPVVRPDVLLGLPPPPPGPFRVVLVFHPGLVGARWGLLVERALTVMAGENMVDAPPGHWLGDCVASLLPDGDTTVPVLDPERLLQRSEALALVDLAERARDRMEEFRLGDA